MTGPVVRTCKHCGMDIVPTEYGTWGDRDNPGFEVCDLADDYGPSHEPALEIDGYRLSEAAPGCEEPIQPETQITAIEYVDKQ